MTPSVPSNCVFSHAHSKQTLPQLSRNQHEQHRQQQGTCSLQPFCLCAIHGDVGPKDLAQGTVSWKCDRRRWEQGPVHHRTLMRQLVETKLSIATSHAGAANPTEGHMRVALVHGCISHKDSPRACALHDVVHNGWRGKDIKRQWFRPTVDVSDCLVARCHAENWQDGAEQLVLHQQAVVLGVHDDGRLYISLPLLDGT